MRTTNRFTKGSALYTCRCCGRATRDTGRGDNELVRLCAECYDLAGFENMLLDGATLSPSDLDTVRALRAVVAEKGGDAERAFDVTLLPEGVTL